MKQYDDRVMFGSQVSLVPRNAGIRGQQLVPPLQRFLDGRFRLPQILVSGAVEETEVVMAGGKSLEVGGVARLFIVKALTNSLDGQQRALGLLDTPGEMIEVP